VRGIVLFNEAQFAAAKGLFENALANSTNDTTKAVIDVLLGNTYLAVANDGTFRCDKAGVMNNLTLADKEFTEAQKFYEDAQSKAQSAAVPQTYILGGYSRPKAGLAAAGLLEVRWGGKADPCGPHPNSILSTIWTLLPLSESADIDEANDPFLQS